MHGSEIRHEKLSLININSGAAVELFDEELKKVLTDMNNIAVRSDVVREIRLTVKIKPSKDRVRADVSIEASSKLAPRDAHEGSVILSTEQNKPIALVAMAKQVPLPFEGSQQ